MADNAAMLTTLLSLFAALLLGGLATAAEAAPDKVRLQLKWFHQFQFAGYYMALEKGFYREAGLDVELMEGGSREQNYIDNMLAGKTEFAIGSSALAAITQTSPGVLLVRADSGIHTPLDLAGKRLILSENAEVLAMLHKEGIDLSKINVQPRSVDVSLDDLVTGKTDAYFGYVSNEAYQLKMRGVPYRTINPRDFGITLYNDVLVTSERLRQANPNTVDAFLGASRRGWEYALSHVPETVRLIHLRYAPGKPVEQLEFEARELHKVIMPELVPVGHMNPERWRSIGETYTELGLMGRPFNLDGFLYDANAPARDLTWLYLSLAAALTAMFAVAAVSFHIVRIKRRLAQSLKALEVTEAERRHAMEDLRTSEERHRILLGESSDPIFSLYPDGQYCYVNRQFAKGLGREPEEIIGKKIWDIFPQEEGDRRFAAVREVFEHGESQVTEARVSTAQGDRCLITSVQAVVDDRRQVTSVICISKDITERKAIEERLAHSELRYRVFFETAPTVGLVWTEGFIVTDWNRRAEEVFGWKRDEVLGRSYFDFLIPEAEKAGLNLDLSAMTTSNTRPHAINTNLTKDGRVLTLEWFNAWLPRSPGQAQEILSLGLDITERKVADEVLRASERNLQMVLDNAADAVFVSSPQERWAYVNEQALALLGYSREELVGMSIYDIVPPSFRETYRQELARQKDGDKIWRRDLRLIKRDGSRIPAELNAVRLPDGNIYGSCRDITERNRAAEELRVAKETAESALAAQRQFVAMLSHEYRSPLAVIDAAAHLLSVHLPEEGETTPILARIRRGVSRLTNFLDNCLTDDRLASDTLTICAVATDVAAFAASVKESAQLISERHRIVTELASDLPRLEADPQLLHILLLNLLSNAIKYSPAGRDIRLCIKPDGPFCRFEVSDQGRGIPADELPFIFDKYMRGRAVTTTAGAGLGLWLVFRIAALHGGSVDVQSQEGAWTRVTVMIPLRQAERREGLLQT